MLGKKMLLTAYQYADYLVTEAIQDLSHQESLLRPPGGDNPANWILGHILCSRSNVQAMLGLDPVWDFDRCKPYLPDSEPLTPESPVEYLEVMIADLEFSLEKLLQKMQELTDDQLMASQGENSLGEELAGYAIHEAYHAGELAMIRNSLQNSKVE